VDNGGLDGLRARIEAVLEELDDMILDVLREAVAAGETTRPAAERRLVRARNAVQRALGILGGLDDEPGIS